MAEADFTTAFVDAAGYEELRKHIRESTEFTKELALVLEERAEVEMNYSKLLTKLSVKANKITRTNSGTLSAAWSVLCGQFDAEATIHKTVAETIMRDLQKPLKKMAEQQAKSYKLFESPVEKAVKTVNDSRAELMKKKKAVYAKSKESQNLFNQASSPNNAKGKPLSDKEVAKLKSKSEKADETVVKTETEYIRQLMMTEKARQDHELAVVGASSTVQKLEIERINQQKSLLGKYSQVIWDMTPKIQTCCESINRALSAVVPSADVTAIAKAKGKIPQPTYQMLLDSYEEEQNNGMSMEQRKAYVARKIKMIDDEMTRVGKGQETAPNRKSSTKAPKDSPKPDSRLQSMHTNDSINMLTASKFKILSSLAEMDGQPRPVCALSEYIRVNRDKQGSTIGTLHYPRTNAPEPSHVRSISSIPSLVFVRVAAAAVVKAPPPAAAVAVAAEKAPAPVAPSSQQAAAAAPVAPSSQQAAAASPVEEAAAASAASSIGNEKVLGVCSAIYDFEATADDQLDIKEGDVINVLEKGDDGWWRGEINGRIGLFPASYAQMEGDEDNTDVPDNDEV
ncbi:nostrin-like [Diadema antillarum]|uniref:nostrin-like n=1 Tax=Diadema antillarum TaxID=105358 RepID=UPI003A8C6E9E